MKIDFQSQQTHFHNCIKLQSLYSQPTISVPIASARTVPQLEEIVQVVELTQAEVEKLNTVSA